MSLTPECAPSTPTPPCATARASEMAAAACAAGSGTSAPPATATPRDPHDVGNVLPADIRNTAARSWRCGRHTPGGWRCCWASEWDSQSDISRTGL